MRTYCWQSVGVRKTRIDHATCIQVAAKALCDPRTVAKYVAGKASPLCAVRIYAALSELGLQAYARESLAAVKGAS